MIVEATSKSLVVALGLIFLIPSMVSCTSVSQEEFDRIANDFHDSQTNLADSQSELTNTKANLAVLNTRTVFPVPITTPASDGMSPMNQEQFFTTWNSILANYKGVVDIVVHEGDESKVIVLVAPVKYVEGKEISVAGIECSNVASSSAKSTPGSLWLEIVNAAPSTLSILQGTTNGSVSSQVQPWSASASNEHPSPMYIGLLDQYGD